MIAADGALTDWITAAATVATALATAVAGFAAWRTGRREARSILPIIEPTLKRLATASGRHIAVHFVIRNVLYETLIVESARVVSPRATILSKNLQRSLDVNARQTEIELGSSNEANLGWTIGPVGATSAALLPPGMGPRSLDTFTGDIYLTPRPTWKGGEVKIVLVISSKGLTIRRKSVTITRHIE